MGNVLIPAKELYPVTIICDRYGGVYSGAAYTAWRLHEDLVPTEASADDVTCGQFWDSYKDLVGKGDSPNEALEDLYINFKNL